MARAVRVGLVHAIAAVAAGLLAAGAAAHPPIPEPLAAVRYLQAQRAGFGSPSHAAALAARAMTRAQSLRAGGAQPSARMAGTPAPSAQSFTGAWSALGPAPVTNSFYGSTNTGRVDSVAVVPSGTHAGEIFIGTAGGGVWSSTDGGTTWQTHTDNVPTGLAIGALAIDPTEPETIYAGTGEANDCGDCFYGGGVLKSIDGGNTWTVENPSNVFTGVDFASIVVDPNHHENLYAGTSAGLFGSTDGGAHWNRLGSITKSTHGVVLDPNGGKTTIYAAVSGSGIEKSTNGGTSFTRLTVGSLTSSEFGVTSIGVGTSTGEHPTANETLYVAVQLEGKADENGGDLSVYVSSNGGTTWTHVKTPAYTNPCYAYNAGATEPSAATCEAEAAQDQGFYDNAIAVDPANPAHVIAAGMAIIETTTAGTSWSNVNGQGFFGARTNVIHPDFHALTFAMVSGGGVTAGDAIIGCDGGVYEYDPTKAGPSGVTDLNKVGSGLNTTQLYEDLSVYNNGEKILGGLQDNGTALFTAGSSSWPDVLSGDGGYNAINPLERQQQFGEADMHLEETVNGWASNIELPIGINNEGMNGNFVPPMTIISNSSKPTEPTVFYGGQDLWATHNPAAGSPAWSKLTTTGAAGTTAVSAIAVAPSNPEVMYVGFDNGALLVSTDANSTSAAPTFTEIHTGVAQWITHIDVNPTDPGSIAVSFSSSNTHFSSTPPMVETGTVTLTGTPSATYTNITGNLPTGVASNSVVFDNGGLIVATDIGVFSTSSPSGGATIWAAVGSGLPNVQVIGLSVDASGNLYAATHGRGVWELPTKALQTIGFTSTAPAQATVGGPVYTVTATASSGLSVALSIDSTSTSVCALSGSTSGSSVSFHAAGTCTIDANQAGDATHEPAPQVQQSFTVFKKTQSVFFTSTPPATATVGGSTYTASAAASSGLPVVLSIDFLSVSVCSLSGSASGSVVSFHGAGTCTIEAEQPGNAEYEPGFGAQQSITVVRAPETGSQTTETTAVSSFSVPIPMSELFSGTSSGGQVVPVSNVVRVVKVKQGKRPGSVTLSLQVPGPGAISVVDASSRPAARRTRKHGRHKAAVALVRPAGATATSSGVVTLQVSLTRSGVSELKRKHRLAVKITIAFTPTGGTRGTLATTVVLASGHAARWHK